MALIPRALRPSVLIRRKAMYSGVFGQQHVLEAVAVWCSARRSVHRSFGRNVEVSRPAKLGWPLHAVATATSVTAMSSRSCARPGWSRRSLKEHRGARHAWATSTVLALTVRPGPTSARSARRVVIVRLRQPRREIDGRRRLARSTSCSTTSTMNRESFLVIRNGTLVPGDGRLDDGRHDRDPARHLRRLNRARCLARSAV